MIAGGQGFPSKMDQHHTFPPAGMGWGGDRLRLSDVRKRKLTCGLGVAALVLRPCDIDAAATAPAHHVSQTASDFRPIHGGQSKRWCKNGRPSMKEVAAEGGRCNRCMLWK